MYIDDDIIIIPPLHALIFFFYTKMYIEVDIGCIVNTFGMRNTPNDDSILFKVWDYLLYNSADMS